MNTRRFVRCVASATAACSVAGTLVLSQAASASRGPSAAEATDIRGEAAPTHGAVVEALIPLRATPGWSVASMAALGDSITAAWGSLGEPDISDHLENSWATGTAAAVSSHASRFAPGPTAVVNLAQSGVSVASDASDPTKGAVAQAQALPNNDYDYVVFEGGSADLCGPLVTSPEAALSPADFQSAIAGMLSELQSHLAPGGRVLLASIPNWHRIWEDFPSEILPLGTRPPFACPLLFSAAANAASRDAEATLNVAYNAALQQACAAYSSFCRYDGGAVYGIQFELADLSTTDYFHLSVSGQARLAAATWPAAIAAPRSGASVHRTAVSVVKLTAVENGLAYDKKTVKAKAGRVKIVFRNLSPLPRNVRLEQGEKKFGGTKTITKGTTTAVVTLKRGVYHFFCSVPGHEDAGMSGTLKVT